MARSIGSPPRGGRLHHRRRSDPDDRRHRTSSAVSTRTRGPRCTSRVRVGRLRTHPGRGTPDAEAYTRRRESQAAGRRFRSASRSPSTSRHRRSPARRPKADRRRPGPEIDIVSGDDSRGWARGGRARAVAGPLRDAADHRRCRSCSACASPTSCSSRSGSRSDGSDDGRATTPLEQVQPGVDGVGGGGRHRGLRRAGQRHLRGDARSSSGRPCPRPLDPALTLAARLEVGSYSAAGAQADDATVAWEAAAGDQPRPRRSRPPTWQRVGAGSTPAGSCARGGRSGRPASGASR